MARPPSGEPSAPRTPPRFVPTLTERVDASPAPAPQPAEAQRAELLVEIEPRCPLLSVTERQAVLHSKNADAPASMALPGTVLATPINEAQRIRPQREVNTSGVAVGLNRSPHNSAADPQSNSSGSAWRSDWITSFDGEKARDDFSSPATETSVEEHAIELLRGTTSALGSAARSTLDSPAGNFMGGSPHSASDVSARETEPPARRPVESQNLSADLPVRAVQATSPLSSSPSDMSAGRDDRPLNAASTERSTSEDQPFKTFLAVADSPLPAEAADARDAAGAGIDTSLNSEQAGDFREMLVHRVLQRVDVALDKRLHLNIASVVEKHSRLMRAELREEVEGMVRDAVIEALAAELAARTQNDADAGFY